MSEQQFSSMRQVQIIRHASTRLNNDDASIDRLRGWSNIPLSRQGIDQARILAMEVAKNPPDVLLCSDLDRCIVTAQIIAEHIGVRLEEPTMDFRPWHVGEFTGRKALEVLPIMTRYVTEWPDIPLPDGESFNSFRLRFLMGMGKALRRHEDRLISIVTHNRSERLVKSWAKAGFPLDGAIDTEEFKRRGAPTGYCGIIQIPLERLP